MLAMFLLLSPELCRASSSFSHLFGYREVQQHDIAYLSQWVSVLKRHAKEDVFDDKCRDTLFNRCHLNRWFKFIDSIRHLPKKAQVEAVNRYANKNPYVLDIVNYGLNDYWAIIRELLFNGGDCEDYAIAKFFSLGMLEFPMDDIRIVILQDTNLRIAHAVMAVRLGNDVFIMDNQTDHVISHRKIVHYVPLYSLDEKSWWVHMPSRIR